LLKLPWPVALMMIGLGGGAGGAGGGDAQAPSVIAATVRNNDRVCFDLMWSPRSAPPAQTGVMPLR
jgi:hypothetical protein